ncbi:MAG TPA: YceI family protein [Gaiellaceae bacterium]|nr:YceI family protein [Gaiellaceae bacterium]
MNIPTLPHRPVSIETWTLDPTRTTIEFAVRHAWGLSVVRGHFTRFDGTAVVGPDGPALHLRIDADSVDTGNSARDRHLRSWDFFDAVQNPDVEFTSTSVDQVDLGTFSVTGELRAAGESVPLAFDASVHEVGRELEVAATTTVDPQAFGMSRGPLWSIRPPATLTVSARLVRAQAEDGTV